MPELKWRYGYFGALAFMFLVSVSMVLYFRHRGWFGRVDRTGQAAGLRAQLKGDDP